MSARTAKEFRELRREVFGSYINWVLSLANVLTLGDGPRTKIPHVQSIVAKIMDSSNHLPWREGGKEEAGFCIETLYRAFGLLPVIGATPAPPQKRSEDAGLAAQFFSEVFSALLHLSCLMYAIDTKQTKPSEEVLCEIVTGMRSSVRAYSCIRRGVGLREIEDAADLSDDPLTD